MCIYVHMYMYCFVIQMNTQFSMNIIILCVGYMCIYSYPSTFMVTLTITAFIHSKVHSLVVVFRIYDVDRDGYISKDDLGQVHMCEE